MTELSSLGPSTPTKSAPFQKATQTQIRSNSKAVVAEAVLVSLTSKKTDTVFSVTADEILKAINRELGEEYSLDPKTTDPTQYTPEKTAQRIVDGVTALFSGFRSSNPELQDEAALDRFLKAARSGIDKGYDEAFGILKASGAFDIEGVEDGVSETKKLIEEKLLAFEQSIRSTFQIDQPVEPEIPSTDA